MSNSFSMWRSEATEAYVAGWDAMKRRLRGDPEGEALIAYTRNQWHPFLKGTRKDEA